MKSRLQRIEIRNFKAFREFDLNLEGRHLLLYGANGSGKSSLYWALYTFLQSARKPVNGVQKYFEAGNAQNLLNIHEDHEAKPGQIAVTLREVATKTDTTYRISHEDHGTRNKPAILKGDLASDFITYRFFFGFSHFRNSQKFNLWPLFEKEILPFCVSTSGSAQTPLAMWNRVKSGSANPWRSRGLGGTYAYSEFHSATSKFAGVLSEIVDSISKKAQSFYDTHFSTDDPEEITLKVGLTTPPKSSGDNQSEFSFTKPRISFGIQVGGQTISRPQAFLNEAKLTQLALSVRFAASLVNLHESDLKLLVLDDLLVSLDMSNRMKVVELLLGNTFSNYQKIILTHDLGFFHEFRRKIGNAHPDWQFVCLRGDPTTTITCDTQKTDLQKAEDYLHGNRLDEAALCLRKAVEETAKRFIEQKEVVSTKDYVTLTEALRAARNRIKEDLPVSIYEKVVRNTPSDHRSLLIASSDDDIDNNGDLDDATKGRLKCNRNRLRQLVTEQHVERLRQIKLIDDILACTERVLNPAAHAGDSPLYEKEVEDALDLVTQLESSL